LAFWKFIESMPIRDLTQCCCGCTLRSGVIILTAVELVLQIIGFVGLIDVISRGAQWGWDIFGLLLAIINFIFVVLGFVGAINYRYGFVRWYYVWYRVVFVVGLIIHFIEIFYITAACTRDYNQKYPNGDSTTEPRATFISQCRTAASVIQALEILLLYPLRLYFIWVIRSFLSELAKLAEPLIGVSQGQPASQTNTENVQPSSGTRYEKVADSSTSTANS